MKLESKITALSVALLACAALVGGLGWYTWTLHRQMDHLNVGTMPMPAAKAAAMRQGNLDPFAVV